MKGFAPCRRPLKQFKLDDSMIRWIADNLNPTGGYLAYLLGLIFAAWQGSLP